MFLYATLLPVAGFLLCLAGQAVAVIAATPVSITVGPSVISETLPQYVSFDTDWWHNTGGSGGDWGNSSILYLDLQNARLNTVVDAFASHSLWRIGGSEDNVVKYLTGNMTEDECHAPVKFRNNPVSLCMTMPRWDAVNKFAQDHKLQIVFGVSLMFSEDGSWQSQNVYDFLQYTAKQEYPLYGVELGEEQAPNPNDPGHDFDNLIAAYKTLRSMVTELWPNEISRPKVMGPCVGMTDEEASHFDFMEGFLAATVPNGVVDNVVMHSYNNDGGWNRPGFLSQTLVQAKLLLNATKAYSDTTRLWAGEIGPHNGGGIRNVTDRVVSSFWYNDALGKLAEIGVAEFGRQALVGSHYGLLQEATFQPNPDYYTALLWSRLMGNKVLNVSASVNSCDDGGEGLHIYAHCNRQGSGNVTLAVINICPTTSFVIDVSTLTGLTDEYLMTADDLLSHTVSLNGTPLGPMQGATLPSLLPNQTSGGHIVLGPSTFGLVVLSDYLHPKC